MDYSEMQAAFFGPRDEPAHHSWDSPARRLRDAVEPLATVSFWAEPAYDRYAALGGVGPREAGDRCRTVPVHDVGQPYDLGPQAPARLYGVDASRTVSGHSDISNPSTYWALYDLVRSA